MVLPRICLVVRFLACTSWLSASSPKGGYFLPPIWTFPTTVCFKALIPSPRKHYDQGTKSQCFEIETFIFNSLVKQRFSSSSSVFGIWIPFKIEENFFPSSPTFLQHQFSSPQALLCLKEGKTELIVSGISQHDKGSTKKLSGTGMSG